MDSILEGLVYAVIALVKLTIAMMLLLIIVIPIVIATPFIFFWPKSDADEPYTRMVTRRYLEVLGACTLGYTADWFS